METRLFLVVIVFFILPACFVDAASTTADKEEQIDNKATITILVDDAYKPFSYLEDKQVRGLYSDILRAASQNIPDFNIELKAIPWERGKHLVKTGAELAIAPVFFHGHDWPYLYPYSIPLYREDVALICNTKVKQSNSRKWPAGYTEFSIGNMRGFDGWGGLEFRELVEQKSISYQEVGSAEQLILMVAMGRVDCILMEEFAFAYHMRIIRESNDIDSRGHLALFTAEIVGSDYTYVGYSEAAISSGKFPNQYEFRKALDIALYKMHKSGELSLVISKSKRRYSGTPLSAPSY